MRSSTAPMERPTAHAPSRSPFARTGLVMIEAFVAVTAIAGGTVLVIGALLPQTATAFSPPDGYLAGTPFTSYVVPGLVLAVVVGGVHAAAFILDLTRHPWRVLVAATAGFALLTWIFVQMIFIPFSFLQAIYFAAGLAEMGFIMLTLGITAIPRSDQDRRLP
ncbi:hypothetical protein [Microbacterium sp.]|uniref:hypothetical protein n=1 Tax=Microbacterium sp. TaxID=51671 RepID=UPI002E37315B|nr:hypothetical protein [Microbacterium sp.]HEX5728779.1 hypothetical protein [Microbacterium sp.]